jgi:competence protein ComEC
MHSSTFFTIFSGTIFGMICGMFILPNQIIHYVWIGIIVALLWSKFSKSYLQSQNFFSITTLCIVFTLIGLWRVNQFHTNYSFTDFDHHNNQIIILAGIVTETPTFKPGTQLVRIHPESINGIKRPETTRDVVLKFSNFETFSVGDRILVTGKFTIRSDFESDSGRIVQYRLMSYSRKIAGDIKTPKLIQVIKSDHNAWQFFASIKKKFLTTLNELFISPASGLLSGIIIGDTSNLDSELLDIFRAVGLIHIVVLSGYNITLVANFFVRMFASLGYYRRLIAAMMALLFFIVIVGISQTAMRAGIMALCAFAARYYIRPYVVTRGIAIALLVMAWISPYALLFDLSLQLSFLATIGIVYVFPLLSKKYEQLTENTFGEILLQTIAVNILTLPIIIYQMGTFSLISFPINIAVLVFVPWLTIGGFTAVFIGMVFSPLGRIVAFPFQVLTNTIIKTATWTAQHDPFKLSFPTFSIYWIVVIYGIILYCLIKNYSKNKLFT